MISNDIEFERKIDSFVTLFGKVELEDLMNNYVQSKFYKCKTKQITNIVRIKDIIYLEIFIHNIYVHTNYGVFLKYGNLTTEEKLLNKYGFIRCNQSFLVSIDQIKLYENDRIILNSGEIISISKAYQHKVINAISAKCFKNIIN